MGRVPVNTPYVERVKVMKDGVIDLELTLVQIRLDFECECPHVRPDERFAAFLVEVEKCNKVGFVDALNMLDIKLEIEKLLAVIKSHVENAATFKAEHSAGFSRYLAENADNVDEVDAEFILEFCDGDDFVNMVGFARFKTEFLGRVVEYFDLKMEAERETGKRLCV